MKKLLFIALLAVGALCAQDGTLVNQSDAPSRDAYTKYFFTSGTTTYSCQTNASGEVTAQTVSAITNANPAVLTITGHGFSTTAHPTITLTGMLTGPDHTNSTANGVYYIATVVDANTLTIPLDTSSVGSISGTILLTTSAPRLTRPIWRVQQIVSDASGNPVSALWALNGYHNACTNRSTLSYQ